MLGEKVCRVLLSQYLSQVDASGSDGLLYPQRVGVEVPQFA